MEFVDTHCHIQSVGITDTGEETTRKLWAKADNLTVKEIIDNARQRGVNQMICVGCDLADSQLAIDFVKGKPECYASIGIHPHEATRALAHGRILPNFAALAGQPKVVAVGECGLDYYYKHSPKADQLKVLEFQMELATESELPVIFHVREAFDDFWQVFESHRGIRGVLHSFTDNQKNLDKALSHGLFIGVNGIATFTKNLIQLDVYKAIPKENLLLETDAPFLTPVPFRGQICEPKHVRTTAEFMAKLRSEKLEDLAAATTANAIKLFNLD